MSRTDSAASPDLDFGADGLLTVVTQAVDSQEVLMVAHATRGAIERTRETGLAHYYSRSRDERWQKGESSGHVQHVEEVRVDCDGDSVLYLVTQEGGACHTGHRSCFYRTLDGDVLEERVFDPDAVYE